jgi:penicillin-insensitive murein endopeptidase
MDALAVSHLTVHFEGAERAAVEDVSYTLEPGNIATLIGPNGAGKTTLLRAMLGFIPATGAVRVFGRPVREAYQVGDDGEDGMSEQATIRILNAIAQQAGCAPQVRWFGYVICTIALIIVTRVGAAPPTVSPGLNPWSQVHNPSTHQAEIRGSYAGGCLHGAQSILNDQGDFFLMRTSRRHYYAHPSMRAFIKSFAHQIKAHHLGVLLVGDISQARGGPILEGHASHQVGLDADIWFWLDAPAGIGKLSQQEREQVSAISMLNGKRNGVNRQRFGTAQITALRLAAADPKVQRIFVNPHIKNELCHVTHNAAWLKKIRPWWGHHYHFHVRLACPATESRCRAQAAVPKGAGCGKALAWWFSEEAADTLRKSIEEARKKTDRQRLAEKLAKLPASCSEVLSAPARLAK